MPNAIVANNFVSVDDADITARSETSTMPKVNVMSWASPLYRYRADDLVQSDTNPLLIFDFGSAQSLAAVAIDNVNFDTVRIFGHASDLGTNWSTATYDSGDLTVSLDNFSLRYKAYIIPATTFNYRYMAIGTPAAATAVGDYVTKWEIGRVLPIETMTTLEINHNHGYTKVPRETYKDMGRGGRIPQSTDRQVELTIPFHPRSTSYTTDMHALNAMSQSAPITFYENQGDTSQFWVCLRDTAYSWEYLQGGQYQVSTQKFKEAIGG